MQMPLKCAPTATSFCTTKTSCARPAPTARSHSYATRATTTNTSNTCKNVEAIKIKNVEKNAEKNAEKNVEKNAEKNAGGCS